MKVAARLELEEAYRRLNLHRESPTGETREVTLQAFQLLTKGIQSEEVDLALEAARIIRELENET